MQTVARHTKSEQKTGSNQKSAGFISQLLVTELALLTIGVLDSARTKGRKEKLKMN